MSAGIDSLAATELTTLLTDRLGIELEPTVLFDHPTIVSLASFVAKTSTKPEKESSGSRVAPTARDVARIISKAVEEIQGTAIASDTPLMSAGIDSLAATELTALLTDRLGTELEPTVLFDHPTIDSLAKFVAAATDAVSVHRIVSQPGKLIEPSRASLDVYISQKLHIQLPGPSRTLSGLRELVIRGHVTNQRAPISRWDVEADIRAVKASATYGAFFAPDTFSFDASAFGISRIEARVLHPMELLVLEAYNTVSRASSPTSNAPPTNLAMGCFLGASGMFKDIGSSPRVEKAHTAYSASSG
jgi:acyl carrier protein